MNVIKEDLTRLRNEKEKYLKRDQSYKKMMNLSSVSGDTNSESAVEDLPTEFPRQNDSLRELKQQTQVHNNSLVQKVQQKRLCTDSVLS